VSSFPAGALAAVDAGGSANDDFVARLAIVSFGSGAGAGFGGALFRERVLGAGFDSVESAPLDFRGAAALASIRVAAMIAAALTARQAVVLAKVFHMASSPWRRRACRR
jgi:hypothetical protein